MTTPAHDSGSGSNRRRKASLVMRSAEGRRHVSTKGTRAEVAESIDLILKKVQKKLRG
jgi:hypothetical protein